MTSQSRAVFAISVLFAINTMNFFDRQILGVVGELVKKDWGLSDTALGSLGTAFIVLYAIVGVPLGRLADRGNRSRILVVGVFVWSLLTAASGLAANFAQMFVLRLGVGVGEATCAPASNSLIGDLVPSSGRARALAIFMLGLPIGTAVSYWVCTWVANHENWGWPYAFYIALIPGLLCAFAAWFIHEPQRGASEIHNVGASKREGSPYLLVLSIPTMWWIIASGALHNFNMYALNSFLIPFLSRYHGTEPKTAGSIGAIVMGVSGIFGLLLGGLFGDRIIRKRTNGRMLVATIALGSCVPLIYLAIDLPVGQTTSFLLLMSCGVALMYVYYSTVYSTIQDVIEPSLRATAMALYFFAMYLLGGMLGPIGLGYLSDFFARRASRGVDLASLEGEALATMKASISAQGLHSAMYVIPAVCLVLAVVLFAGSLTVTRDAEKLQRWMRESVGAKQSKGEKVPV